MIDNRLKCQKLSKSAASTLNKVQKLIEEDKYCPEIIQQIDSVIGLLRTTKKELLQGHLHNCLEKELKESNLQFVQLNL